jgi:type III pantothenate kinase
MLAIDVGNTNITAGVFAGDVLEEVVRVSTSSCISDGSFLVHAPGVSRFPCGEAVVVGVRPDVMDIVIRELSGSGASPVVVGVDTPMGIESAYRTPDTLGADRLVCAAAAFHLHGGHGRPVVVVDMGTATTIDYVSGRGVFMGGVIAPGMMSAYRGLLASAPMLPRIEEYSGGPLIGADTVSCLRAGIVKAHAAMITSVAQMMGEERGESPNVVVTGGLSGLVEGMLPGSYVFDGSLILKGLLLIHSLLHAKRA